MSSHSPLYPSGGDYAAFWTVFLAALMLLVFQYLGQNSYSKQQYQSARSKIRLGQLKYEEQAVRKMTRIHSEFEGKAGLEEKQVVYN